MFVEVHLPAMFIQTEPTPNPQVLKFLPGRDVAPQGVLEYRTIDEAAASPLAEALFELEGVEGVFFGADYVSVTRGLQAPDWTAMKAPILSVIMDHFVSGAALTRDAPATAEDVGEDSEIVAEIKGLLDSRIRPAVAQDGGDITFKGFRDGVVYLNMKGACSGCPSSTATLKHGVQNLLRHFVPEVQEVEAVM